jgi:hypothetical protein
MPEAEESGSVQLPILLTEKEAATLLRVKAPTVRAERIRGNISYTRIGHRIFYTLKQLAEYLDRQAIQAAPNARKAPRRSATPQIGGSHGAMAKKRGDGIPQSERRAVSAVAQEIFRRRPSLPRKQS